MASGHLCKIEYSDSLVDWITHNCQIEKFGARNIDTVLNTSLLPLLARYLIDSQHKKASTKIRISVRKNNINITYCIIYYSFRKNVMNTSRHQLSSMVMNEGGTSRYDLTIFGMVNAD